MDIETKNPDFKITRDGSWWHDGAQIKRAALAKLFADRALVVDDGGLYWLQTPFEKYPVHVEDVPFVIVDFTEGGGDIHFKTNMDETIKCGPDHPLELRNGIPYINVRNGLYARVGRSVLYNLIETYGVTLTSQGKTYPLGELDD